MHEVEHQSMNHWPQKFTCPWENIPAWGCGYIDIPPNHRCTQPSGIIFSFNIVYLTDVIELKSRDPDFLISSCIKLKFQELIHVLKWEFTVLLFSPTSAPMRFYFTSISQVPENYRNCYWTERGAQIHSLES